MFEGKRIGIGWPIVSRRVDVEFAATFLLMDKPFDWTLYLPSFPAGEFQRSIASVRNNIAQRMLGDGMDECIFMDTDQGFEPDALVKILSHDVPIVAGVVHRRYPPFDPILIRLKDGKPSYISPQEAYSGELLEVDETGFGFVRIQSDVFMDVPWPWFEFRKDKNGKDIGEDIHFYRQAKAAGFPLHVDTSIQCRHFAHIAVNRELHEIFLDSKGITDLS